MPFFVCGSSPSASRKWSHVDVALNFLLFTTCCDEEVSASEGVGRLRACEKLSEGRTEEGPEVASDWEDENLLKLIIALEGCVAEVLN